MRFESSVFVDPMLLFSVTSYCIFGMIAVDIKPFSWHRAEFQRFAQ